MQARSRVCRDVWRLRLSRVAENVRRALRERHVRHVRQQRQAPDVRHCGVAGGRMYTPQLLFATKIHRVGAGKLSTSVLLLLISAVSYHTCTKRS